MRSISFCFVLGTLVCGCQQPTLPVVPDVERTAEEIALDPTPIRLADGGQKGWKVSLRGGALATPAVADGFVHVGGGLASHSVYAFDAVTGETRWRYDADDNGPTAVVASDGTLVFSTESCELEVLDAYGRRLWKKWLGDPLLSAPAIDGGMVYAAYPAGLGGYNLACFELQTGVEMWNEPIPAEVITAPVISGTNVIVATLEGTLACRDMLTGRLVWSEATNAISAPVVSNGVCYFSRLATADGSAGEDYTVRLAMRGLERSAPVRDIKATQRRPEHASYYKHSGPSYFDSVLKALDNRESTPSEIHISEAGLVGIWLYQGSSPAAWRDRLFAPVGDKVVCVALDTREVRWEKDLPAGTGAGVHLSPPAVANGKLFVGTRDGQLVCLAAESGEVLWSADIGEGILVQPAVANGRVFVSTTSGSLVCLETGDPQDDGWPMWGANPSHDGVARKSEE